LAIIYPDDVEDLLGNWNLDLGAWDPKPAPDLSRFTDLRTLKVHNIFGNLKKQRKGLVSVLIASPHLDVLSISINKETMSFQTMLSESFRYKDFFRDICEDFRQRSERRNCAPLKLRKLVLGSGISLYLPNLWSKADSNMPDITDEVAFYLSGLTDLNHLVEVHVQNDEKERWSPPEPVPRIRSGHAWETFSKVFCPRLQRLSIYQFDKTDFIYGHVRILESVSIKELVIGSENFDLSDLEPVFEIFKEITGKDSKEREKDEVADKREAGAKEKEDDDNKENEDTILKNSPHYSSPTTHIPQVATMLGIRKRFLAKDMLQLLVRLKDCVRLEKLNIGLDIFNGWGEYVGNPTLSLAKYL
jgi:hypothetical protein